MSALPIAAPQTAQPVGAPVPGLVEAPRPVRHPLAPASAAQAWRRRVAVLVLLLTVVGLVAVGVRGALVSPADAMVPVGDSVAVVQPGETVWDIAERHAPAGMSTGEYAGLIVERNDLDGGAVDQWQVLRLP